MKRIIYTILFFTCLAFCFTGQINAQGDIFLFPKRVVFEQDKRAEIINLANSGTDTVSYSVSFVQIRMNDNGSFENISVADSNQFFADPFIRFHPRTVTLAPGESQVVKLQITGTNSLAVGEYRSHLYFRSEPANNQIEPVNTMEDTSSISFKLIPVYGMTIPIIIRIGEPEVNVEISNLTFQRDKDLKPNIRLHFNRIGNKSAYGNIKVNHVSPGGKTTQVGEVTGFAVYTPGALRKCVINLTEPEEVDFSSGEIIVVYSLPLETHNFEEVEATLTLGNYFTRAK